MARLIFLSLLLFSSGSIFSQCFEDRHSTLTVDQWISCEKTVNPNSEREDSHWIMYDFGESYELNNSTIWNCNAYDQTDMGIRTYVVDISNDGINWQELGEYDLAQANSSAFYEGVEGPDFDGEIARYVLITTIQSYQTDCACISEIKFETTGPASVSVVEINELNVDAELFPNPAVNETALTIQNDNDSFEALVQLLDLSGRELQSFQTSIQNGENKMTFDLASLTSGNYVISTQSERGVLIKKLIIINEK